jgi:2-phosphosulfolactate phosphatase
MPKTVVIDCFPESAARYVDDHAIVAVDVIRATTTATTAVALGRRCFPVPSLEAALPLAARLDNPLLVGELGGNMPYGFDLTNSPAALAARADVSRPMILLSTSGTKLITDARASQGVYIGSLRGHSALAEHLAGEHERIAVLGAGTRGEFREEDQLCCAWIAERLLQHGYKPERSDTERLVERWSGSLPDVIGVSNSADYLRQTGQTEDLDFILAHVDDLSAVFRLEGDEIVKITA